MVQGLSAWEIIGIFLAVVLVVALVIFGIVLLSRRILGKRDESLLRCGQLVEKGMPLAGAKFDVSWANAYIVHVIEVVNRRKWG